MKKITRFNRTHLQELLVDESIFAIQNGLIGVRGNFSEGYGENDFKQTIINGFYNYYDYKYEENSPAFPQKGQRIINVIDGQTIEFYVNNKAINLTNCELRSLRREYNLETGCTIRLAEYKTSKGFVFAISEEKLVSFVTKEILAIRVKISSPNYTGKIKIVSKLILPKQVEKERTDSRINQSTVADLQIVNHIDDDLSAILLAKTTTSDLYVSVGMAHNRPIKYHYTELGYEGTIETELADSVDCELTKYIIYYPEQDKQSFMKKNHQLLKKVYHKDYDYYLRLQTETLSKFWKATDFRIKGNSNLEKMIQYNVYQLNSCAMDDSNYNIPAKGLTGEGYEGHYFWDTEIYMIPFFMITDPNKAKNLLLFRYKHFKESKIEALNQGSTKGVKIPWRTINGFEVSPYYPAGSAQYHINSDVAYAVIKYVQFTDDIDFLIQYGFEMLLETGRFLLEVGNTYKDEFHINNVTGPDEYSVLVNDNYYTNSMAKYHFEKIVSYYKKYKDKLQHLHVTEKEIKAFSKAAKQMKLCYDEKLNIFVQDDAFLQRAPFDFTTLSKDKFPLFLNYHPLFIYKHQILKQADVLLSMFLLDYNNLDIFQKSFDYYLPKTTHDSSLSKCIHSIVAFRLGNTELGYEYLKDIAKIDLENSHNNTHHGIHIANSGGIYLAITYGILGLRIHENRIIFRPILPKEIEEFHFHFTYQGNKISITLNQRISITVEKPITLGIYNELVAVTDNYHCMYNKEKRLN